MSDISDDELKRLLKELDKLDEVPTDVAARMDATIDRLAAAEKSKKSSRFTSTSWALAAGFTLIFGTATVLNLGTSPIAQTPSNNAGISNSSKNNDNDILTSTNNSPKYVDEPISEFSSGMDYSLPVDVSDFDFMPSGNFGNTSLIPANLLSCIDSLGLAQTVSLIDSAYYKDSEITAVWSAVSMSAWQVFIISPKCEGVAEVFIRG